MSNPWFPEKFNVWSLSEDDALSLYENAFREREESMAGGACSDDPPNEEYQQADLRLKRLTERLAARPDLFRKMRCWMVDVHGTAKSSQLGGDDIEEWTKTLDTSDLMNRQGPLVSNIRGFLEDKNYNITDMGGSVESWHLGCPCIHEEVPEICQSLYENFKAAFDNDFIYLDVHFWGFRLDG